jgi:hypothetical protein
MHNERMLVLNMLDEGVITVGEALDLLDAMHGRRTPSGHVATIEFPKFSLIIG